MPPLSTITEADLTTMVAQLHALAVDAGTVEECAQRWAFHLYDNLLSDDGEPASALVRCFRTSRFSGLSTELRDLAGGTTAEASLDPATQCLVLLGSAGENSEWNSRHRSQNHRVIPLLSPEMVARSPMIAQLFRQLGIDVHVMMHPTDELLIKQHSRTLDVFYVRDAVDSAFIPAQAEFVRPYGVHSVIGFGGVLPTGNVFAVILFTKVHVEQEVAERFQILASGIKHELMRFESRIAI